METTEIHIGTILKSYIDTNRITKAVMARKLDVNDSVILRYQKRSSLQTSILIGLSHALKHNFFADIAASFPENYSNNVKPDTTKDDRIKELELENTILKAEVAILVKTLKG